MSSLSISRAWDETVAFVRNERKLMQPIVLALLVVPVVIVGLIRPTAVPGEQPPAGAWMLVALAALVISLIGQMGLMRLALGWNGRVADALRLATGRVWFVILAFILVACLMVLISLPLSAVLMLATGADLGAKSGQAVLLVSAAIVFLFGIVRFTPVAALAMEEGPAGPVQLIRRAWAVTKGSYGRLLGFFLLFFLGTQILSWVVEMMATIAAELVLGRSDPMTVSRLVVALLSGVVQGSIQAVYAVMIARITAQLTRPVATVPEVSREG